MEESASKETSMNYHANAKTTQHQRNLIKQSKQKAKELAKNLGVSVTTVAKWKKRDDVKDKSSRPENIKTAVPLTLYPMIEMLRKNWFCDIDIIWQALRQTVLPQVSRSSVYRHLVRVGLEDRKALRPTKARVIGKFRVCPPGFLHIDVFYLPKIDGKKRYLFAAIDRATRGLTVQVYDKHEAESAVLFLQHCRQFYPFKIYKILTDNGGEFTNRFYRSVRGNRAKGIHAFEDACKKNKIRHVMTKIKHPWTNGLIERTGATIKDATVNRHTYDSPAEMIAALYGFQRYFNEHRPYKAMGSKTPKQLTEEWHKKQPKRFFREPYLSTTS